tara:strand:+ start:534 stop:728 length:195 start_codon:yes stop_codon:yes gene_type:complete
VSDHTERMKTEHAELSIKLISLETFIHGNAKFKSLCSLEQARMIKQSAFMRAYADVLESRIWVS